MKTCAYCGSELESKLCDYCQLELEGNYILEDGKRIESIIDHFPDQSGIFQNTKELLQLKTIELLCLLQHARKYRAETYKLRLLRHQAEKQQGMNEAVEQIEKTSYNEYENATRKVWVLENIIKDRIGYYPQKVTENFISMYAERIKKSEKKIMKIKSKIKSN